MDKLARLWRSEPAETLLRHGITLEIHCDSITGLTMWTTKPSLGHRTQCRTLGKRTEEPANRPLCVELAGVVGSGSRDLNGDLELHLGVQTSRHRVGADGLNWFVNLNGMTIKFDAGLCGNGLDHVGH